MTYSTFDCNKISNQAYNNFVSRRGHYFSARFIIFQTPKVITIKARDNKTNDVVTKRVYTKNTLDAFDAINDIYCMPQLWELYEFISLEVLTIAEFERRVHLLDAVIITINGAVKGKHLKRQLQATSL